MRQKWSNRQPLVPLVVTVLLLSVLGCERQAEEAAIPDPEQAPLWVGGEDGYHTYRIPALLTTRRGSLLAFCEGRRNNARDHGDIDLLIKRSTDGGKTWSAHQIVYEEGGEEEITIGNPSPVVDQDTGTIWMPFCRDNKEVLITNSTDDGLTWSEPVNISDDVVKPGWVWVATGPGVSIQLARGPHKGRLVVPCDHGVMVGEQRIMHSHVFYSDDHGVTWRLGGLLPEHTDEAQVVELSDGDLLLNMRSYWGRVAKRADRDGMRALARSSDGGLVWGELTFHETLIEPVCQGSFLRYTDAESGGKNRLLFSNPASKTDRVKLTVRLSYDEGKTWPVSKQRMKVSPPILPWPCSQTGRSSASTSGARGATTIASTSPVSHSTGLPTASTPCRSKGKTVERFQCGRMGNGMKLQSVGGVSIGTGLS